MAGSAGSIGRDLQDTRDLPSKGTFVLTKVGYTACSEAQAATTVFASSARARNKAYVGGEGDLDSPRGQQVRLEQVDRSPSKGEKELAYLVEREVAAPVLLEESIE